jgi:hypothetical protein
MLGFADVYPRLYQVAKISQARLEAWRDRNQSSDQDWNRDLGGFFNSEAADRAAGIVPRKPEYYKQATDSTDLDRQQDIQAARVSQVPQAAADGDRRRHLRSQPSLVIHINRNRGEDDSDTGLKVRLVLY